MISIGVKLDTVTYDPAKDLLYAASKSTGRIYKWDLKSKSRDNLKYSPASLTLGDCQHLDNGRALCWTKKRSGNDEVFRYDIFNLRTGRSEKNLRWPGPAAVETVGDRLFFYRINRHKNPAVLHIFETQPTK